MTGCPEGRWLLLIHQIPPKPAYFRVKVWRRLQSLGAVPIKNTVYVLPMSEQTFEDFQWLLKEIVQGGGEASLCSAAFVEGLTDDQVEALFQGARNDEYAAVVEEAKLLSGSIPATGTGGISDDERSQLHTSLNRLKRRLASVVVRDFFGAPGRDAAESLVAEIEARWEGALKRLQSEVTSERGLETLRGTTWVTRKGVYVDRMGCAWLIKRFIDPDAAFKFVSEKGYRARSDEVRFDMFEGEFTHEGDLCTFEVLAGLFFPHDSALGRIGQIVHDLDFKESKFKRPETAGIAALIDGIAAQHKSDEERLASGIVLFNNLYEYFRRK
ncbi:MAG: chromate resistance protein ChrB domain-containing protein [Thermodesulfobacteriota bacterium]